jgi:hypothetical protein
MSIPFPSAKYAQAALNSIAVDPAFTDTKTKKTSIKREMHVRNHLEGESSSLAYLDVKFNCNEDEVGSMRTCVSSFVANLSLVCETMKEFGN